MSAFKKSFNPPLPKDYSLFYRNHIDINMNKVYPV
jgi:hypothetical protein